MSLILAPERGLLVRWWRYMTVKLRILEYQQLLAITERQSAKSVAKSADSSAAMAEGSPVNVLGGSAGPTSPLLGRFGRLYMWMKGRLDPYGRINDRGLKAAHAAVLEQSCWRLYLKDCPQDTRILEDWGRYSLAEILPQDVTADLERRVQLEQRLKVQRAS